MTNRRGVAFYRGKCKTSADRYLLTPLEIILTNGISQKGLFLMGLTKRLTPYYNTAIEK